MIGLGFDKKHYKTSSYFMLHMMTTESTTNQHLQVFPEVASRWLFRPNLTARDLELPVVIHPRTKVARQRVIFHQRTQDEKRKIKRGPRQR